LLLLAVVVGQAQQMVQGRVVVVLADFVQVLRLLVVVEL
jgi:hypothetical protein